MAHWATGHHTRETAMNAMGKSLVQRLTQVMAPHEFSRGKDDVLRRWNLAEDICCAVAVKLFEGGEFVNTEVGFISPKILEWFGLPSTNRPLPYYGNGPGIYFRLEDFGIREGFTFPPGGWLISNGEEANWFGSTLMENLAPKFGPLLIDLLNWQGWVRHFREETVKFPCGRGIAWTMLGYSMLATPGVAAEAIQAVIDEHARQDGSTKVGNRIDIHIMKQRELLLTKSR